MKRKAEARREIAFSTKWPAFEKIFCVRQAGPEIVIFL